MVLKKLLFLYFFSLLLSGCKDGAVMLSRTQTNINKNWSFQRGVAADESKWESVHLPHTPKIEPLVVNDQWQGVCWYKKSLTSS